MRLFLVIILFRFPRLSNQALVSSGAASLVLGISCSLSSSSTPTTAAVMERLMTTGLTILRSSISLTVNSLLKPEPAVQQLQIRSRTFKRRIAGSLGDTRPRDPLKHHPEPNKYRYIPLLPPDGRYTTKPLKCRHLGGRHPETGRVVVRTIHRGNKKNFRWVDYTRHAPEGETIEEKVYHIRYDPLNTFLLALVAREGFRRWIPASENVKPGDVIRTTNIIPRNPVRVKESDAYPLGAMPPGTLIHNVEQKVGEGGFYCRYAGAHAEVGKRMDNMIVVKLAGKSQVALDERCMAVVGKCSNTQHRLVNLLCPQRAHWKGKRPVSGLWHRKDGWCGRKVHPPKPLQYFYSDQKNIDVLKSKTDRMEIHLLDD